MRFRSVANFATTAAAYSSLTPCNGWITCQRYSSRVRSGTVHSSSVHFLSNAVVPKNNRFFATSPTVATTEARMSSTVAVEDEETTIPNKDESKTTNLLEDVLGETIAEGTIVSSFPGGFCTVQISEEFSSDITEINLTVDGLQTPKSLSSVKVEVGDYQGKQVLFDNGTVGVVVAHRPPLIFVYNSDHESCDNNNNLLPEFSGRVKVKSSTATVSVSQSQTVVDCFGQPLNEVDSKNIEENQLLTRNIFSPIPQVKDIALINNPMLTGITMIDSIASIGQGQNMLLIGHDIDNMRSIVVDLLKTQLGQPNTKCVYASTEQQCQEVSERFQRAGITSHNIHLVAPSKRSDTSDTPSKSAEAVAIAATACAIGESYALENGKNSLVIVDTIDYHKKFWDTTTRIMVDVFGADAVVKSDREGGGSSEMRGFFSSLIQRSAQYKDSRGGGSVTLVLLVTIPKECNSEDDDKIIFSAADFENSPVKTRERINLLVQKNIPLTAATLKKINIPIPSATEGERRFAIQHIDDLISMSDGQIWLDERLENKGRRPALDPQRSVTRIGIGADTESRADAPALRRIVEGLRLELSQASDIILGGSKKDAAMLATQNQNLKQQALLLAMHQESVGDTAKPRRLSESCAVLLAAQKGYLNRSVKGGAVAGSEQGTRLINDLLKSVEQSAATVMKNIDETLDITDEEMATLDEAIQSFVSV